MLNIDPTSLVPKPILWVVSIPCMILLLPIGILYFLFCLTKVVQSKIPFQDYKHDIFYSMVRPGFYMGFFLSLIICRVVFIPRVIKMKQEEKRMKERLKEKRTLCEEWLDQFDFIDSMNRRVQLYTSKGEAVGRVLIHEVDLEQASLIESKKSSLPDKIYLEVHKIS